MILCIGGTGAGKSNALLNYLSRASGEFYKIIICSFSTTYEQLYQLIKKNNKDVELINNIDDVPDLHSFDDNFKDKPKIIVFDDFINLSPKEMVKINEYLISGRKFGFSVWLMAQNYVSVGKIITRNVNYFILFKLNDNVSIDRIIKNHNVNNINKEAFKRSYIDATKEKFNFFMVDLKTTNPNERLRKNILGFYHFPNKDLKSLNPLK